MLPAVKLPGQQRLSALPLLPYTSNMKAMSWHLERACIASALVLACACSSTSTAPLAASGQPPVDAMGGSAGDFGGASSSAGALGMSAGAAGMSVGAAGMSVGAAGMSAGAAGLEMPPRHVVSPCPAAGTGAGKWENVTPPGLNLSADFKTPAGGNFGAHAFV